MPASFTKLTSHYDHVRAPETRRTSIHVSRLCSCNAVMDTLLDTEHVTQQPHNWTEHQIPSNHTAASSDLVFICLYSLQYGWVGGTEVHQQPQATDTQNNLGTTRFILFWS